MDDVVFVPVPWERLAEVRALLGLPGSAGGTAISGDGSGAKWSEEELRRIFEDCTPATRRVLRYLAERAGDWVYGTELAKEAAGPGKESTNIGPYLRSLTVAVKRHHGAEEWPIEWDRGGRNRLFRYRMLRPEAVIVRRFAD